ncbi:hypothetical protein JYU34_010858 [Plutella xylostella]|uniref:SET domain-containing protein n=1 Tax=Plutella xylostella TaxID=51655 RepID=A0ABQ7QFF3_PLUXY|nr:hypothetical protein JYU34_010858 [Plutella xylostella]
MADQNTGFFKKFHDTINNSVDDILRNNFTNLETNEKRVSYLCSLPAVKNYDLTSDLEKCQGGAAFPVQKDMEKARELKNEGNGAVQKGDWGKALQHYSHALMNVPLKETEEASILLANRSAALNHLDQHEDAISDIQKSLKLGYPRHLRYKVLERKARCLLVLKRNREAITAFQDTISALDEATSLDKAKRTKLRTDAKIMLEMLHKGLKLAGNPKDPEPLRKVPPKAKLTGKANVEYPSLSVAVNIDYDDVRGRFATANRDIQAGEVLLVEKPYSGVLLAEYAKTHCQNCFIPCPIPVVCPNCPNVIFCSEKCLDAAQKSYHKYECKILPLIWKSGCSITCHIALRMVLQHNKEYFSEIAKQLTTKPPGPHKPNDYKSVYQLVTHEDKRTKQDFLHRTQMIAFLVKLLEICGYFDGKPRDNPSLEDLKTMAVDEKYKDDVAIYGSLVLKNLQLLQFNAHEVFELQCKKPKVGSNIIKHDGTSVFLAGALFPTLSLFNHSCDPGIVRYFCGPTIVVRAVKTINKGEEVSENYGPIFTSVPKDKRQARLKEQYWFDCSCVPCQQNWPLYEDMNENYMRFKCDSDKPCPNVIPVTLDCKEFMVKCGLCQQYTNILKGLKSLQDTDMAFRLGKAAMEAGQYGEAFKKFVEVLKLYDATLLPPYRSYYDTVQELRHCMLAMGNYRIV